MTHIDAQAIAKLTTYYNSLLPCPCTSPSVSRNSSSTADFKVLDLCGSWLSHLPLPLPATVGVFGLGLNEEELSSNETYNLGWKVFDLNGEEKLDWIWIMTGEMDLVICTVSIDYLVYPLSVLKQCHRILKQGPPPTPEPLFLGIQGY